MEDTRAERLVSERFIESLNRCLVYEIRTKGVCMCSGGRGIMRLKIIIKCFVPKVSNRKPGSRLNSFHCRSSSPQNLPILYTTFDRRSFPLTKDVLVFI
jgi:hypothetical protein